MTGLAEASKDAAAGSGPDGSGAWAAGLAGARKAGFVSALREDAG